MTGATLSWSYRRFGPGVFKWKTLGLLLLGPVGPVPCFNEMVRPFGSGKLYICVFCNHWFDETGTMVNSKPRSVR